MNIYAILSFISFLLFFQALVFSWFLIEIPRVRNAFILFAFSFSIFSFFNFLQQISTKIELVYLLDRFAALGWLGFPIFTAWLLYVINEKELKIVNQIIWFLLFPVAFATFIRFQIDPYSLKHFYFSEGVRFYTLNSASPWFFIFVGYLIISVITGLYALYLWKKNVQQNRQKLQVNIVIVGLIVFFLAGIITNVILPEFGFNKIGPLAHVNVLPFGAALFYSLVFLRQQAISPEIVPKLITNHLREFVFYFDQQGQIYSVNRFALENLRYNQYEIIRLSPEKLFSDYPRIMQMIKELRLMQLIPEMPIELYMKTGLSIPVLAKMVRVNDFFGNFLGAVFLGVDLRQKFNLQEEVAQRTQNEKALTQIRRDLELLVDKRTQELFEANERLKSEILEKERAEQQIIIDLHEKIKLVQEIHHRVKNNIQIIVSLTNMLATHKDIDALASAKLRKIAERIRSISAIHEDLYSSANLSRINFSEFIKKLTGEIYANKGKDKNIIFRLNAGHEFLEIDQAIPCGIIYTELLSNAIEHAFPKNALDAEKPLQIGNINVEFYKRQDEYTLLVSDNGVGAPDVRISENRGFSGLGLVDVLVKQHLKGRLITKVSYGTTFILKFSM